MDWNVAKAAPVLPILTNITAAEPLGWPQCISAIRWASDLVTKGGTILEPINY